VGQFIAAQGQVFAKVQPVAQVGDCRLPFDDFGRAGRFEQCPRQAFLPHAGAGQAQPGKQRAWTKEVEVLGERVVIADEAQAQVGLLAGAVGEAGQGLLVPAHGPLGPVTPTTGLVVVKRQPDQG
jgi:hypothetical protein